MKKKQNPNLIKNEFMWEEPKKKTKLYKNWKLYAIALPVIAIAAGTGSGIYYGVNGHSKKVDLSTLHLNTQSIAGFEGMSKVDAFEMFLKNNENISNLETKVEVGDFSPPSYNSNGNLTIKAKANSGCKGEVAVMIDTFGQVNLNNLIKTNLIGFENMNQDDAFSEFLSNQNQNLSDLRESVTLDFSKPSYTGGGSLTITAKPNTKYTGEIKITITAIEQTALTGLDLNLEFNEVYTDQQVAFDTFLASNQEQYPDLSDNVQPGEFTPSNWGTAGSLIINATSEGKYQGNVTMKFARMAQTALSTLNTTTITGLEDMNQDDAFNAFLKNNEGIDDLGANVDLTLNKPTNTTPGSLTIKAKPNTKYTGEITIIITAIGQAVLTDLHLNLELSEAYTNQDDAFNAFLELNKNVVDLRGNVRPGEFVPSGYGVPGSLEIIATNDGKYVGMVKVVFGARQQKSLSTLVQTNLVGTKGMSQDDAFEAFLKNNPEVIDLKEYVLITFDEPDYDKEGSLTITAKPNTKYTGTIIIKISGVVRIDLNDLNELNKNIPGTKEISDSGNTELALTMFLDANKDQYPDLSGNVTVNSFSPPTTAKEGTLNIGGTNKYTGSIVVTFSKIPAPEKDQQIVDVISDPDKINFGATMGVNQKLQDFIDGVINGGEHSEEPHWYLKGQLLPYLEKFLVLKEIDYDKFKFLGLFFLDETTPLTDEYIKDNAKVDESIELRVKFSYGTIQEKFVNFSLSFKA
ncbi:hypothetical protein [Mesoplasma whartonense]|uniref:hypothetical protein n=1 Tax=Mesoplasma whartonense TaxID=2878854 RepID=UPI002022B44A|nr:MULTISPECIES: hypothetical protein [unclassified Mesoplasma]MCL8212750.1 hypothetical protein [Mesoplasma sp. JKS002661]MCL8215751.1 hypothetical protein [Mesoplasma sp. JKS002657]